MSCKGNMVAKKGKGKARIREIATTAKLEPKLLRTDHHYHSSTHKPTPRIQLVLLKPLRGDVGRQNGRRGRPNIFADPHAHSKRVGRGVADPHAHSKRVGHELADPHSHHKCVGRGVAAPQSRVLGHARPHPSPKGYIVLFVFYLFFYSNLSIIFIMHKALLRHPNQNHFTCLCHRQRAANCPVG